MITTTSYGTWLPGDLRGYVHDDRVLPGDPALLNHAKQMMSQSPVVFTPAQQISVFNALCDAAWEFDYTLTDASVEAWHLHWIVGHGFDPVDVMVGRMKTRMRQALGIGRVWTEGYCHRCMTREAE